MHGDHPRTCGEGMGMGSRQKNNPRLSTITTPKKKSWKREERLLLKRPHAYIMNKN